MENELVLFRLRDCTFGLGEFLLGTVLRNRDGLLALKNCVYVREILKTTQTSQVIDYVISGSDLLTESEVLLNTKDILTTSLIHTDTALYKNWEKALKLYKDKNSIIKAPPTPTLHGV